MASRLTSLPVVHASDIENFFDRAAADYSEQHGPGEKLLAHRLALIRSLAQFRATDRVLEIGCGPGNHLLPLAGLFAGALGTDLSRRMIEIALQRCHEQGLGGKVWFQPDNAETLAGVPDRSFDVAFCVGAFEHMVDKGAVLRNVARVLEPGGRFVCLTPNGDWLWYRRLAPWLRLSTTRLSTDRFVGETELRALLAESGFESPGIGYWTFVPRGDMPRPCAAALDLLDLAGRRVAPRSLRGGLMFRAIRR
jgi:2-polyprenyl-6-hydroxyphenyl methylase/3-demethylubiquinone-9 3-methyltransferase